MGKKLSLNSRFTETEKNWLSEIIALRSLQGLGLPAGYPPAFVTTHLLNAEIKGLRPVEISGYRQHFNDLLAVRLRELSGYFWVCHNLQMSMLDKTSLEGLKDPSRLTDYAALNSVSPSVILVFDPETGLNKILDGRHRITVAMEKGEETWLMGYVGVSPHYLLSLIFKGYDRHRPLPSVPRMKKTEEFSPEFHAQVRLKARYDFWVRARELNIDPSHFPDLSVSTAGDLLRELLVKKLTPQEEQNKAAIIKMLEGA